MGGRNGGDRPSEEDTKKTTGSSGQKDNDQGFATRHLFWKKETPQSTQKTTGSENKGGRAAAKNKT